MSGHSNFHTISGSTTLHLPAYPQVNDNIDVAGNRQAGGANDGEIGVGPQEEPQNVQTDVQAESSKALVRQLDILLARAAAGATRSADATAVKAALDELGLPEDKRKAIGTAAAKAQRAFMAINDFTGRQIAESVAATNGKFDWNEKNAAGVAVKAAIDAQSELAKLLRDVINETPAGKAAVLLDEAVLQCDRRTCEIQTLVCEFADLNGKADNADPEVRARLDATLGKLLPRKALEMHGNPAALETTFSSIKEQVEPLAQKLDAIAKNPSGKLLSNEEVAAIGLEIDQMANALDGALKSGVVNGIPVDRSLLGAAKDALAGIRKTAADARNEILKASMLHFAEKVFALPPLDILSPRFLPFLKVIAPSSVTATGIRERLQKAARAFAETRDEARLQEMKELAAEFAETDLREIVAEIKALGKFAYNPDGKLLDDVGLAKKFLEAAGKIDRETKEACMGPDLADFVSLVKEIGKDRKAKHARQSDFLINQLGSVFAPAKGLASQVFHLELMAKSAKGMDDSKVLTSGAVRAAFEGNLRFTTLVESRLRGIADGDVDPMLDDINVESSKTLGSGNVNTVCEVTYKNGGKYVFKPESEGRMAFEELYLAKGIEKAQMVAGLNMASQKTAEALGLDDVVVKTSVGSHNGSFGIFMEKAQGSDADGWRLHYKAGTFPKGPFSPSQVKKLPDEDYAKVVGGLMRKANRLEWFDLITGQGDRHGGNYFVEVDGKDFSVSLKGIDNDASFPAYRKGLRTFAFDENTSDLFESKLFNIALKLYPGDRNLATSVKEELLQDPGVSVDEDDGTITIDTTKAKSPLIAVALRNTIGVQNVALPDYIDKDVFDHLMSLEKPGDKRDKYIADLKAHLSEDAVDAAVARLDEAIAHAKALEKKGHVVSEAAWSERDVQSQVAGKIRSLDRGADGKVPKIKKLQKVSENDPDFSQTKETLEMAASYQYISDGYFTRDFVRAIAKPGWFDEEITLPKAPAGE